MDDDLKEIWDTLKMDDDLKEILDTLKIMTIDSKLNFLIVEAISNSKTPEIIKKQKELLKTMSERRM